MSDDIFEKVDLRRIPKLFKLFLTMFLISMGIGYIFAIMNIQGQMGLNEKGIAMHYAGDTDDPIGFPPKDFATLASTSHTHMMAMSLVFFSLGMIFIFTKSLPSWLKKFVLVDSFTGIAIAVGSFWLIRYTIPQTAYLMMLSGFILGFCCFFETTVPLYEMWLKK